MRGAEDSYGKNIEDGLILHTARHTATTRLVEAGLDYDTIRMITSYETKELIAHYSHKHPQSVARAPQRRSNKWAFVVTRTHRSRNLSGQIVDR
jgi:hypothetical protein